MERGEIWLVDLADAKGHEHRGERPALVMGSANGLVVVIPFTATISTTRFSHTLLVTPTSRNGLDRESVALVFQIVSLDRERFVRKIGSMEEERWDAIVALARDLMNMDE
jgi:mRNA interferase MazF